MKWQDWARMLHQVANSAELTAEHVDALRAYRLEVMASGQTDVATQATQEALVPGRVALGSLIGHEVLKAFAEQLRLHPRFAILKEDGSYPREEVVAQIVSMSGKDHGTPFRRFFELNRMLHRVVDAAVQAAITERCAIDPCLMLILREYEAYLQDTARACGVSKASNTIGLMKMSLRVDVTHAVKLCEIITRLFPQFKDVPLTREAARAAMACNTFNGECARQNVTVVRIIDDLIAGCDTRCYSNAPEVVYSHPHGALLKQGNVGVDDLKHFRETHTGRLALSTERMGLFIRPNGRVEPWLNFDLATAHAPKTGHRVGDLRLRPARICPLTARAGISTLNRLIAVAVDHEDLLGFALAEAARHTKITGRLLLPFDKRPTPRFGDSIRCAAMP